MKQSVYHSLSLQQKLSVFEKYYPKATRDLKRYTTLKEKNPRLAEFYRRANNVIGGVAWRTPEDYKAVQAMQELKAVQNGTAKPIQTPVEIVQIVSDNMRSNMTEALEYHLELDHVPPANDPHAVVQLWEGIAGSMTKDEREAVAFFWQDESIMRYFQQAAASGMTTEDALAGMRAKIEALDESFTLLDVDVEGFAPEIKTLDALYTAYEPLFAQSHGKTPDERDAILNTAQEYLAHKKLKKATFATLSKEGMTKTAYDEKRYAETLDEGFTAYEEADPEIVPLYKQFARMFARNKGKVSVPKEEKPSRPFFAKAEEKLAKIGGAFSAMKNSITHAVGHMPRMPRAVKYVAGLAAFAGLFYVGARLGGVDFGNLNKNPDRNYLPQNLGARGMDVESESESDSLQTESASFDAAEDSLVNAQFGNTAPPMLQSKKVASAQDNNRSAFEKAPKATAPYDLVPKMKDWSSIDGQGSSTQKKSTVSDKLIENASLRCMTEKKRTGNGKIITTPYEIRMAQLEALTLLDSLMIETDKNPRLASLYNEVLGILDINLGRTDIKKMTELEKEMNTILSNAEKAHRILYNNDLVASGNSPTPLGLLGGFYHDHQIGLGKKLGANNATVTQFADYTKQVRAGESRMQKDPMILQSVRELDAAARKLGLGDFSRMAQRGVLRDNAKSKSHSFHQNAEGVLSSPYDQQEAPRYVTTKTAAPVFALR